MNIPKGFQNQDFGRLKEYDKLIIDFARAFANN